MVQVESRSKDDFNRAFAVPLFWFTDHEQVSRLAIQKPRRCVDPGKSHLLFYLSL